MAYFLCGEEKVKRLVRGHLHCTLSYLKRISKCRCCLLENISADTHAESLTFILMTFMHDIQQGWSTSRSRFTGQSPNVSWSIAPDFALNVQDT